MCPKHRYYNSALLVFIHTLANAISSVLLHIILHVYFSLIQVNFFYVRREGTVQYTLPVIFCVLFTSSFVYSDTREIFSLREQFYFPSLVAGMARGIRVLGWASLYINLNGAPVDGSSCLLSKLTLSAASFSLSLHRPRRACMLNFRYICAEISSNLSHYQEEIVVSC